ncbi:MAG: DUF2752 domain-containing protein [Myxococcales bacterium]|nr:DUF2752 domain-containing protein [Myxococcales bacterium]
MGVEEERGFRSMRGGALVLASGATLAGTAMLEPDARGYGTIEQLGLVDACPASKAPECPSCGLLTSVVHGVRGEFVSSVRTHGAGLPLVLCFVWAFVFGVTELLPRPLFTRRLRRRISFGLALAVGLGAVVTAGTRTWEHTPMGALHHGH